MNWLLVVVGGMVGAPLRYLTDRAVQSRHDMGFPWGTFTVNVAGSCVLGFLTGAVTAGAVGSHLHLLLGTGLCGALTTYSTFSYETLSLARGGDRFHAAVNAVASVTAGLGAVYVGLAVARALWS
ncbi:MULTISPECIES: fluoride efflux transporter CrcB [Streptomyces]|uniref:Fluoride-specific ion channel FluC n=1 Tax=Streptomyces caniscabiei TaxID=2746961 RepID=A0ABU4N0Q9_9ACTN|nr:MULTISPECIES: fluoride efflux transporter CrcB [Streptomyces]MBE4741331.1 fluoride efflux transporter CrcB [Streptomyces caniscabiei]MBE4761516.1 fluoride efflux transporter CrcB [Streptomyces caniscabiei]MBE4775512.1 fluoride efflux transporter CrcB [Streptomyces caniscabiei]MBE4789815.1 fluoride efflux transporter CrcB [Streptomyces caniscabiei]MBE4799165.1 fluoride efflux transporter CrcB [Streptomyces caniscabiei]